MMTRKMMIGRFGLFVTLLLPGLGMGSSTVLAQRGTTCPEPHSLTEGMSGAIAHIRFLADDALEGRETGTAGARCAGEYIAGYFESLGLAGAGPDGSFFQTFDVRMGSTLTKGNALQVDGRSFELEREWTPFGFSSAGTASAPLVYGGPGVSMPGNAEDQYAHLDLQGKVVVG